ncbi:membrane integrity-associated transporter subunit PqiC [Legionella israelensis]|uniref:Membrane integrity-associated transporter subunit PqiC n=1 Tax=Legionella israelensis TaxID=454 RepID=A0AAX1EH66_9GAMM|nr:membrane integrity-associated transporter subunit PqiC [Legionella israelensis]
MTPSRILITRENVKNFKIISFVFLVLLLTACGRSRESQFYVLIPIPPEKAQVKRYHGLRIGIDKVNIPGYAQRSQLIIHCTKYRANIEEYHQWAEALTTNVTRVIDTNLSTLLPGAIVESSPWDSKFLPDYHLQVNISQYEVDIHGNSVLRAEYIIYKQEKIIKKAEVYYQIKLSSVTPETLVISMNKNLTQLTYEIAGYFKKSKPTVVYK